jgi:hypothetical protein
MSHQLVLTAHGRLLLEGTASDGSPAFHAEAELAEAFVTSSARGLLALAGADLTESFGVEIETAAEPAPAPKPKRRPKPAPSAKRPRQQDAPSKAKPQQPRAGKRQPRPEKHFGGR